MIISGYVLIGCIRLMFSQKLSSEFEYIEKHGKQRQKK